MATADIKRFTGFIATADGSTHDTAAKAAEHSKTLKVKAALKAAFGGVIVEVDGEIHSRELDAYLFEKKDAILAAFDQEVRLRAKQKPRDKKGANAGNANAPAA